MPSLFRTKPRGLRRLIERLATPEGLGHPVEDLEVVETHISCVLLAGPFAYKFKKPVDFGFLDFSTLEQRRFYCEEEQRLNTRLAPELYLGVVAVTGTEDSPRSGGSGAPIEYCVKMRRFPRAAQLDRVLARGDLTAGLIEALARLIAQFHARAECASADAPNGSASEVGRYALENFTQIGNGPPQVASRERLASLCAWTKTELERHRDLIEGRKRHGRVRHCHGDLHLTNMVSMGAEIVVFDGIEFNAALSCIDVISEIAFLLMDLDVRERPDLGSIFLDRYLEDRRLRGPAIAGSVPRLPFAGAGQGRLSRASIRGREGGVSRALRAAPRAGWALCGAASCGPHRPHPWGLRHRQDRAQRGADPAAWGTTHPLGHRAQAPRRSIGRGEDRKRRAGRDVRRGDDRADL